MISGNAEGLELELEPLGPVDASQENCLQIHYIFEEFFILFFYNKCTYHHIKIALLIVSVAMYTEIHEGNSEEENNGYVVFKKLKYPWISW